MAAVFDTTRLCLALGIDAAVLGRPAWLHLAWIALFLGVAIVVAARRLATDQRRFAGPEHRAAERRTVVVAARAAGIINSCTVAAAATLIAIALAMPRFDPQPVATIARDRDVVVVLDVSRSMLAEDIAPNRLERAKLWIEDLARAVPEDRLSLVAFAGSAVVKCPPTRDHGFFRLALDDLTPAAVTRGGTMVGDALRVVAEQVIGENSRDATVVLITDGEDQGSFPAQAAERIADAGGRIIAVGIGSQHEGTTIPDGGRGVVRDGGMPVRSRLDAATLEAVARATPGGAFLRVGTGEVDLADVVTRLAPPRDAEVVRGERSVRYTEAFQVPLLIAFTLLWVPCLVRHLRRT